VVRAIAALFTILALFLLIRGLILGAGADRCARELTDALEKHDRDYLARAVKSPPAVETLERASSIELAFVRPVSSEWSRVGLFVKTSTKTEVLVLRLSSKAESCEFLRDYEPGPFEGK
jgi:hypothetical protein